MHREISLDEARIRYESEWLSIDEIRGRIKEKINSGDMKIADLADALEQLQAALDDSRVLNVTLRLSNSDYRRLKDTVGEDDRDCIRTAIMQMVGSKGPRVLHLNKPSESVVTCIQCKSRIEAGRQAKPGEQLCPNCSGGIQPHVEMDSPYRYQDHFLG